MTEGFLCISDVVRESIVDGRGLRLVVFCQGCPHRCPGCHNPQTHDFSGGKMVSFEQILGEIRKNPLLQGVTFSGGEPFCQAAAFTELGRRIQALPMPLDITTYSGYTYEELKILSETDAAIADLLRISDFLIDGRYLQSERDLSLLFRGSRNQRYLDLAKTRTTGTLVLAAERTLPARKRYQTA